MNFVLILACFLLAIQYCSASPYPNPYPLPDPEADPDIGSWFKDRWNDAGNWVKGAAKSVENEYKKAEKATVNWVNGAADSVKNEYKKAENWVNGAAKTVEKEYKKAEKATVNWVNGAAKTVEREWNLIAGNVTDFFNKAGAEITKAFNTVKQKWNNFERDANKFFKNVGNEIKKQVDDIKRRIEETGDSLVKVIFQKIYELLKDARVKMDDLSKTADQKFEFAMEKMKTELFTANSQINAFMERMKVVLKTKREKQRGFKILAKYLQDSTNKISSCSEAAIEPIKDLYESTKEFLKTAIDRMEDIIKEIEICLDKGVSTKTVKCGKNLGKVAKTAFKDLGMELLSMKGQLISSLVSEALNFVCIGKTRIEVEMEKKNIEKVIRDLK